MKAAAWLVSSALLGTVLGLSLAKFRLTSVQEKFDDAPPLTAVANHSSTGATTTNTAPPSVVAGAAVAVTNGLIHDFGELELNGKGRHEFVLKNVGRTTLTLKEDGTSCGVCTISRLEKQTLQPGESCVVVVDWEAKTQDHEFRKEAYILTNDPANPRLRLTIKGRISKSLYVEPDLLAFGSVSRGGDVEREVRLYWMRDTPFAISKVDLQNGALAENFAVRIEELTADELAARPGAKVGLKLFVTLKSGLPLGAFIQTIRLATDRPDLPSVSLEVHGQVTGDISFVGARYDERTNRLTLGALRQGTDHRFTLRALVKGPRRAEVTLTIAEVEPASSLQVTLGERESLNNGAVYMYPLTIVVPANSPTIDRLGSANGKGFGKFVLNTTHPDFPTLEVQVKFAVEE